MTAPTAPTPEPGMPGPPDPPAAANRGLRITAIALGAAVLLAAGVVIGVLATRGADVTSTSGPATSASVAGSSSTTGTSGPSSTAGTTATAPVSTTTAPVVTTTKVRPPTSVVTTPVAPAGLGEVCSSSVTGLVIHYPTGWHTTAGPNVDCIFFGPDPITVYPDSEMPYVPVSVTLLAGDYATEAANLATNEQAFGTTEDVRSTQLGGRDAVCLVSIANGEGLLVKDSRTYLCLVDVAGRAVLFSSSTQPGQADPTYDVVLRDMAAAVTPA